ncbi:MAG: hypothetical protein E3K36_03675 [Candidatus Brocadia sp.]|nr:hypothetical protein [Candidatus Brocadia sp.]
MKDKDRFCKKFKINGKICNAYRELSLTLYPNVEEIRTFCKTENHEKCPILKISGMNSSVCVSSGNDNDKEILYQSR